MTSHASPSSKAKLGDRKRLEIEGTEIGRCIETSLTSG